MFIFFQNAVWANNINGFPDCNISVTQVIFFTGFLGVLRVHSVTHLYVVEYVVEFSTG